MTLARTLILTSIARPRLISFGTTTRCFGLPLFSQCVSSAFYGLAPRGWILYPVLLLTVLQYITEPCIQGLMATLVDADRQGSLQVRECLQGRGWYLVHRFCLFLWPCGLRAATNGVGVES